jgi:2-polyprenyl-3-methyl-5-hydroxy-6-metoxy-1,4-benzoquinol methylase
MVDYKKIIYENYYTTHNKNLYGVNSVAKIEANFPLWKRHFAKFLPANKDAALLDIGCGDGSFVYWLQTMGYKNAVGIDLSQEQIAVGTELGISNLSCIDLRDFLKASPVKYDFIIARDVIEHFTKNEVFEILMLINEHLKIGGKFVMQVPNGEGLYYTSIFYGDYTHEMAYTGRSVSQIALNTGYKASQCFPLGPVPTSAVSTIRSMLWGLKVLQLKFWKMVQTGDRTGIFTQNLIAVLTK